MIVIKDFETLKLENTIVTLGKFDGNHLGHQKLFSMARERKQPGMKTVVFTFDIHPEKLLGGKNGAFRQIQTGQERKLFFLNQGMDYLAVFPFNEKTRSMTPEEFVRDVLVSKLGVKVIVTGQDFCFGIHRSGNVDTLKTLGERYHFQVIAAPEVMLKPEGYDREQVISSTLIKDEIGKGNMENAALMLGRPYSISGIVQHGKSLGHTIGFPTINLPVPAQKVLPPDGVYASKVRLFRDNPFSGEEEFLKSLKETEEFYGVTNIGIRPTFEDGNRRSVETFLFDFDRDIYGCFTEVSFCRFLRSEMKFRSVEELTEQMKKDQEKAREYFASNIT